MTSMFKTTASAIALTMLAGSGAAVAKAVKRWSFYPEDDTPPESIPPFQYSVTFDVVRSR